MLQKNTREKHRSPLGRQGVIWRGLVFPATLPGTCTKQFGTVPGTGTQGGQGENSTEQNYRHTGIPVEPLAPAAGSTVAGRIRV
jgi:hypothetical protein